MVKYYKKLNSIGLVVSVGTVPETEEIPVGTVGIDVSEFNKLDRLINPPTRDEELSDDLGEGDDL